MPESFQSTDALIRGHYRQQAEQHGLAPTSTMADLVTRAKETDALISVALFLAQARTEPPVILDIGCGNGYLLECLRQAFPDAPLCGVDFSPEMVVLANARSIARCQVVEGDVRHLHFDNTSFDLIISERCLINLLDPVEQRRAFQELWRVLKPGAFVILLEAFQDGLTNLNKARAELGLEAHSMPYHNLWFDRDTFRTMVEGLFTVQEATELAPALPGANFLSSHYFMSRVVYPAITRAPVVYNSEFVYFFQFLPPIGNYSPIQLYLLQKL